LTILVYPFLALATLGFATLLVVHLAALFGTTYPFEHWFRFLVPGMFVVWIPTVFVMNRLTQDFKQKDLWRAALRGCPKWMRRSMYIVFGYAWVGFFVFSVIYRDARSGTVGMSAVLLAFYGIAVAVLYSEKRDEKLDERRS